MTGPRWRRARQFTQAASFLLFLLLAFLTFRGSAFILPLDLFLRLDPLVGFGAMIASRSLLSTFLLSLVMLAVGLVFGRAWCGWLCPFGAILDWVAPRRPYKQEPHLNWRALKYALLLIIVIAALLGNLSFLALDPITILNRTFGTVAIPLLNDVVQGGEGILYQLPFVAPVVDQFETAARGAILPAQQNYYELGWLLAFVFAAVVALNWAVPRFWCRYLCPLGALYAVEGRFAWLQPHSVAECNHCADCVRTCPTGAIRITKQGLHIDPAECNLCLDCVAVCRPGAIAFCRGPSDAAVASSGLTRRQALSSLFLGIGSVALFNSAPAARRTGAFLVRPPGAREPEFLAKCIRCGECVKVCPTGGLQPTLFESGLEGIWTPTLVSRLGYCDYSCNACGQICPTGAIPPLPLAEKRQNVIGVAYIDTNRCIPWASYRPCIVCQEMCPLPDKAVVLEEVDVMAPDGTPVHLRRPQVRQELCIGCGICEYQCPLNGPAAIHVYTPTQLPSTG